MLENSDAGRGRRRGRRAAGEDPRGSATSCPKLEHVIRMTGELRRRDLARRALRARRRPARDAGVGASATRSVDARRHLHLHLHVGHDRAAEGLRDLARQLPLDARHGPRGQRARLRRGHLPVPAARALVRAADPVRHLRPRRDARLLGARPAEDPPQPLRGAARPTSRRCRGSSRRSTPRRRPRSRRRAGSRRRSSTGRSASARRCGALEREGKRPGPLLALQHRIADKQVLSKIRGLFGGRLKLAVTGAAPINPEILEFFDAAGVLVARGLGDDRDLDRGDDRHPGGLQVRDRRQAVPRLRGQDRRRRRDPGQGPEHLPGLLQERRGDRARRWSTAGCTPATSASSTPTAT